MTQNTIEQTDSPRQADILVELAKHNTLFHDNQNTYITLVHDEIQQTHAIRSESFKQWLIHCYYQRYARTPNTQAIQDALAALESIARYDRPHQQVFVRTACVDDVHYLDLCNESWQVVAIRNAQWALQDMNGCHARFLRREGMLALPTPAKAGSLEMLRELLNLPDEADWRLVLTWMLAALRSTGPHPILIVNGEQGSGKSTLTRLIRGFIDPNQSAIRRPPRSEQDLMITASNSWLLAYDNLSGVPMSLADAMCSLVTGGGFATRKLYTDDSEKLFYAQRPIMMNGIDALTRRPDLLDRAICITLPRIDDTARTGEQALQKQLDGSQSQIMGALLDMLAKALEVVPTVRLERLPRMADFAIWGVAVEQAMGWPEGSFMQAYEENRIEAIVSGLESSSLGSAILSFMQDKPVWSGTAQELLMQLNVTGYGSPRNRDWPSSPRALVSDLGRIAPALREMGMDYHPPMKQTGAKRQRIHQIINTTYTTGQTGLTGLQHAFDNTPAAGPMDE